jgi:flagellar hook assembly protein FlgD
MGVPTDLRPLPMDYAFTQNDLNSIYPDTVVPYQLSESGHVSVVVYNTLGQRLRILVNENQKAGEYKIVWDGKDEIGRQVLLPCVSCGWKQ